MVVPSSDRLSAIEPAAISSAGMTCYVHRCRVCGIIVYVYVAVYCMIGLGGTKRRMNSGPQGHTRNGLTTGAKLQQPGLAVLLPGGIDS